MHKDKLIEFYSKSSKHSNYQVLPNRIKKLVGTNEIHTRTRYENERLHYLLSKINFKGRSVLDIGGNTGFFTFEVLEAGAIQATHYEGNKEHSGFVRLASEAVGLTDKIEVVSGYFPFDRSYTKFHDIILLFNVLHHIGDDYGRKGLSIKSAKRTILEQLNSLAPNCKLLVFQLGFNWQGDVKQPLFAKGTKKEMIEFVESGIKNSWDIKSIGVAQVNSGVVEYADLDDKNIERNDSVGEFLNRPIFILESKKV
jgi:SAM-dependent methyltransferase